MLTRIFKTSHALILWLRCHKVPSQLILIALMTIERLHSTAKFEAAMRWLNMTRLCAYLGTIILTFQATMVICACWHDWKIFGQPGGFDFQTFWAASRLSLEGMPLKAYSWDAIVQTTQQIGPDVVKSGPWRYPPNFLLLILPLALVPCFISYPIFIIVTTVVFIILLRKALPVSGTMVWILGFTGFWLNAIQGQNGSLTASFALGALFLLQKKRPVLAGVCIGMLSIKPHLAILFPLALACAGMWTAFFAAALTAALFTGLSVIVFGVAIVPAFLHGMGEANNWLANGMLPWQQMTSLFASLREMHVAVTTSYAAQGGLAIVAACAVAWVWRNSSEWEIRSTALVAGTFMMSPYIYNYDAVWLGIPLALMTAKALRDGWLRGERLILIVTFFYPWSGIAMTYSPWHVGFGPLVLAALMFLALRRTYLQRRMDFPDRPTVSA